MKIKIPQNDFIVSQRYADICDIIYSYTYFASGSFQVFQLSDEQLLKEASKLTSKTISIYCFTNVISRLFPLIKQINKKIILFTGCSDQAINETLYSQRPNNVIKWFAENVDYKHDDLIPTPIGSLVGSWIGNEEIPSILCGHKDFVKIPVDEAEKENKNLILMSFSLNTKHSSRSELFNFFKDKTYVTDLCSHGWYHGHEQNDNSKKTLTEKEFCQEIYNHKFVLCPEGNGIDCGRTWVSIQLGSIPIVKNSILIEYVKDKLPIFVYQNLEEITEETLRAFKPKFSNYDLVDINYYKNVIKLLKE